jgi:predicted nucleic-acid-binding protein
MIGLDTNVLVRYFVEDDPAQARRAARLIETHCTADQPGFIDRVALCEFVWVLSSGYGYGRSKIADLIRSLLASRDIVLEDAESARAAVGVYESSRADFADALIGHANRAHGCDATATFDRVAARLPGFIRVP